jgi:hypothetical protein
MYSKISSDSKKYMKNNKIVHIDLINYVAVVIAAAAAG